MNFKNIIKEISIIIMLSYFELFYCICNKIRAIKVLYAMSIKYVNLLKYGFLRNKIDKYTINSKTAFC